MLPVERIGVIHIRDKKILNFVVSGDAEKMKDETFIFNYF